MGQGTEPEGGFARQRQVTGRVLGSLAVLIGLVLVAGCVNLSPSASAPSAGPTSAPSTSAEPTASTGPSGLLLLRVTSEGGFIAPSAGLSALPEVVVYTDGRIFTPAPIPAIYPGFLVQRIAVRSVGAAGAAAIADAIRAAGLDKPTPNAPGIIADTGTTVVTVELGGETQITHFAGFGGAPGRPGPSADPAAQAARALLDRLEDSTDWWGAAEGPFDQYVPGAYRIFVAPGGPVPDPSASQSTVAWPLSMPLDSFGIPAVPDRGIAGLRSGIVSGTDADALVRFVATTNVLQPISSGGKSYTLYVRPLLPDETAGT